MLEQRLIGLIPQSQGQSFLELANSYESQQFKGPSSVCFNSSGSSFFFTDSGTLGTTSLQNPCGSVFQASAETGLLKPILLNCLAHPSSIAISSTDSHVYVAETCQNRILRIVVRSFGAQHASVFKQFSGGFGPTAVAIDSKGHLIVARSSLVLPGAKGFVTVLDDDGNVIVDVPGPGPDMTGLCVGRSAEGAEMVYISEGTTGSVHCASMSALLAQKSL